MILNYPASERNSEAIFGVVQTVLNSLEAPVNVLEVASGPGQHVELFARRCPEIFWQPSDPAQEMRDSIDERVVAAGLDNVARALSLDVCGAWPGESYDLILAVNLLHISPWRATLGLLSGAAEVLNSSGALMIYGPFSEGGEHNSQGNRDFDVDLRNRNSQWGIRDLDAVAAAAATAGFARFSVQEMPTNNRTLLIRH